MNNNRNIDIHCRLFWDHILDGMFLHGIGDDGELGRFMLVNAAACRRLGYTEAELLQMRPYDLDDQDLSSGYMEKAVDILRRDGHVVFEAVHRHKDGSKIPVEISSQILLVETTRCVLSSVRYLTTRMLATSELAKSNERLRLIMAKAGAGSWEWDVISNGNVWSNELWQLYGLEPYSCKASYESWLNTIVPEDRDNVSRIVRHAAFNGEEFVVEWRVRDRNGSHRWLMSKGTPVFDQEGELARYIGMVLDITQRKIAEEQNALLEKQVQHAGKMELLGQLAGGIAHDFNNMLAVILTSAEMALGRLDAAQQLEEALVTIRETALHSADLTRQLLAFAQKQDVSPQLLDLNAVIEGAIAMLKPILGKQILLQWNPGDRAYGVHIDPSQIDQIVINLCINARDAITGSGMIRLSTSQACFDGETDSMGATVKRGCYAVLTVTDDGCGISQQDLSRIMEPYFTTKGPDKGSGLGLSTVYGIVRQNQGFIYCRSEVGVGTAFDIYLPLYDGISRKAAESVTVEVRDDIQQSGKTILLVEDDPGIRKLCRKVLEEPGYTVLLASGPSEALTISGSYSGDIALCLTDLMMPEMNGCELTDRLRSHRPGLKALYMSGYTVDVLHGRELLPGFDAFIRKPFKLNALRSEIEKLLL